MSCSDFEKSFFGSVTIGDRGQVVIPSEARAELGFQPGDKLLAMRHPVYEGIMFFKIDAVREFLDDFAKNLERVQAESGREAE